MHQPVRSFPARRSEAVSPASAQATGFDGIVTACVFGWEKRADESGRFMRKEIQAYVDKYFR